MYNNLIQRRRMQWYHNSKNNGVSDTKKTRICFGCLAPISECFGSVNAGDFVDAVKGEIAWTEVRELCPRCATKKIFEKVLDNGSETCYTTA